MNVCALLLRVCEEGWLAVGVVGRARNKMRPNSLAS